MPQGISLGGTQPVPVSGATHSQGRSGAPIKKRRRFFGIAASLARKEDLNPRAWFRRLPLSRGAPSATWVLPQTIWKLAERVGFEPTDAFTSPVFKTGAFNHSAISPCVQKHIQLRRRTHFTTLRPGCQWISALRVKKVYFTLTIRPVHSKMSVYTPVA